MTMQTDGNLVLYTAAGAAVWQSGKDPGVTPPPTPPPPSNPPQYGIHPGAHCTPPGATGYSAAGKKYICSCYTSDGRYHWKPA